MGSRGDKAPQMHAMPWLLTVTSKWTSHAKIQIQSLASADQTMHGQGLFTIKGVLWLEEFWANSYA